MNRLLRRLLPATICAGMVVVGGSVLQTNSAAGQQKKTAPTNVKQLIKQLGDESFDVRRKAREELFELGEAAVPALTATALDKSQDTGYSAVRILSRMAKETTGKAADAALGALKRIAKGDDAMARHEGRGAESLLRTSTV